jgi:hypothetical protein
LPLAPHKKGNVFAPATASVMTRRPVGTPFAFLFTSRRARHSPVRD